MGCSWETGTGCPDDLQPPFRHRVPLAWCGHPVLALELVKLAVRPRSPPRVQLDMTKPPAARRGQLSRRTWAAAVRDPPPPSPPTPSPPLPFLKDFGLAQTKLRTKAAREQERERETGTAINEPSGYRWHTRERSRAPRWVSGSRTKPPEVAAVHEGPLLLGSLYDTCSLHEDGVETVSQTRPGVAAAGTLATTALTPVTTPGFCSPDFSKLE